MISFEQEIKAFLQSKKLEYKDNSSSFKRLDFTITVGDKSFAFDAKEKIQRYNLYNWKLTAEQEKHSFVFDDLAARKILAYGPYSAMVVRDNVMGGYYFFSVLDLFLMPKTRVNRPIEKQVKTFKGKWVADLRNAKRCENMDEVLQSLHGYFNQREDLFLNILECYGSYQGEEIGERGEVRRAEHWETDVKKTR